MVSPARQHHDRARPFEWHDKIPLKHDYASLGVRVVPPAVARYGSFLRASLPPMWSTTDRSVVLQALKRLAS